MNQKEYHTVILGALLHDIGKFLQKGDFGPFGIEIEGKHPEVSENFVKVFKDYFAHGADVSLLCTLVKRHHENPKQYPEHLLVQNTEKSVRHLAYIVSRADNYSASERGPASETYKGYKTTPLACIFSRVQITESPTPQPYNYKLAPLDPIYVFPEDFKTNDPHEVNAHLRKFGDDFEKIMKEANLKDFPCLFTHLLAVLEKYTWCIPSNTQEDIPDISLFDHLKTTSAIAACLYQYHHGRFNESEIRRDDEEKFILVVGDLSGIQDYIFNITGIGVGGTAKRLRARSFYIGLITEVMCHKVLHEFNLPLSNTLMMSGGKFYILLPKLANTIERLTALQTAFEKWSYKNLNLEIVPNLAWAPLSGTDFSDFSVILNRISVRLQNAKLNPFSRVLKDADGWCERAFALDVQFETEEKLCPCCGKFPGSFRKESDSILCNNCYQDWEMGKELPRTNFIAYFNDSASGRFKIFDYSFNLLTKPSELPKTAYLVNILNSNELTNLPCWAIMPKRLANFVPVAEATECKNCSKDPCEKRDSLLPGQPLFFDCIAHESKGRKVLSYLKADVDRLGLIFISGLPQAFHTISRITTMSRMLDLFFSGWVEKTARSKFSKSYTVYSGGDDLLLIGPWDQMIEFAREINIEFRRFTNKNPNITLSAGLSMAKPHTPVFRTVSSADKYLDLSKDVPAIGYKQSRDQVAIFSDIIKWEKLDGLLEEAKRLSNWLERDDLSTGFVRNLLQYGQMYKNFKKEYKVSCLRFLPLMAYDIARNLESKKPEEREMCLWVGQLQKLDNINLIHLTFLANYALNINRTG